MQLDKPLVSIVMPSYNQAAFIEAALDSVLSQDWPRLELIVQDGQSTDGTQELLARYAERDARIRWWTEVDEGPADAINRALRRVRGTVIGWLNSDDCYTPGALKRAVEAFDRHPEWAMVYGEGEHIDANGNALGRYPTQPPNAADFEQGCCICQPTVFFKRTMWLLLGQLDTQLGAAFDFDYWLRAFEAFPDRIGYLQTLQACSRLHEGCITRNQRRRVALEAMKVLARHQGSAPGHWLLTYQEELRHQGMSPETVADEIRHSLDEVKPFMTTHAWQAIATSILDKLDLSLSTHSRGPSA